MSRVYCTNRLILSTRIFGLYRIFEDQSDDLDIFPFKFDFFKKCIHKKVLIFVGFSLNNLFVLLVKMTVML
jgi:hypothetical protein